MSSQDVPSDDSARFSPIHNDDHAGYLWIVTILGTLYAVMATLLRAHIKWGLWGADDFLLAVATLMHLGQSICIFCGLQSGLAKFNSITTPMQWSLSGQFFFASEILSILALCLAKCSVVALMLRLFAIDFVKGWKLCFAALVLSIIYGIGAITGLSVACDVGSILTKANVGHCPRQFLRWQIITAVDVASDILICSLPAVLVWTLNMKAKLKYQVVLAFSFRLPLVALSALHLGYFKTYPPSSEPQFAVSDSLLFQQAMLTWSLISATIPNLKSFMKSFSMGFGLALGGEGTLTNSYPLRSLAPISTIGGSTKVDSSAARDEYPRDIHRQRSATLRPDSVHHEITIHADGISEITADAHSIVRTESQDMIIRKEVEWNVRHEVR